MRYNTAEDNTTVMAVSQGLKKMYGCEKQPTLQGLRSWVERSIKEIDGTLDKCALQV